MQVNFYLASLNSVAKREGLKKISSTANGNRVIVLTPDRNTLNIEKELFEILNINSIFNLDVMTFSRLSKKSLIEKGLYKNILTKHAGVALIKKILLELKEELITYDKSINKIGFSEKIFETISMYKSCRISPEELYTDSENKLLARKLSDIKKIYLKYEEYLGEQYTDNFNQLDVYEKNITKDDYQHVDFYLVDYEDITPHMARIVAKLAKCSNSINICTTYSKVEKIENEKIYNNEMLYTLFNLFDQQGIQFNKIYCKNDNFLSKYLFSNKDVDCKVVAPKVNLVKANNKRDEIKYILSDIKKCVLDKNINYNEVAFIVSDLNNYKDLLKEYCDKIQIPYYIDQVKTLDSNILAKIVLWICEIVTKGIDKYNIIHLLDSGIANFGNSAIMKYKDYILKYNAVGEWLYKSPSEDIDDELKEILGFVETLYNQKCTELKTIAEYKNKILQILDSFNFEDYYNLIYAKLIDSNNIENSRLLTQAYSKISTIWQELEMLFVNDLFQPEDFYEIFTSFVQDIKLSLPPISVNSLIISEFDTCMINESKVIYLLGAGDNEMPKYSVETALLTDREMKELSNYNKLNPTINLINKRKKFKFFEILMKAKERIVFSYVCVDEKGEEKFANNGFVELSKYCNSKIVKAELEILDSDINSDENIISQNITTKLSLDNLINKLKSWDVYNKNKNYRLNLTSVYHSIDDDGVDILKNINKTNKFNKLVGSEKLYFKTGKVSPSQFETYSKCPYMHFVSYGLKLKEKQSGKLAVNDIGDIIHEYLNNIIYDLNNYKNDVKFLEDLDSYAIKNLKMVLKNKKFERFIKSKSNINIINGLYIEVKRLTKAIIFQLNNTCFETFEKEYEVGQNNNLKLTLDSGKQLVIYGKIDRVDVNKANNLFYIIDYKTGSSANFANFDEVKSGKKIQLVLYLMLYAKDSGMKPVGAFYLPVQNKINTTGFDNYKYNGFFLNNQETMEEIDNTLKQFPVSSSAILRVRRKANGEYYNSGAYKNVGLTDSKLDDLMNDMENELKIKAQYIENGDINALPLYLNNKLECKYCKYIGLCNFNRLYGNKYRIVDKK